MSSTTLVKKIGFWSATSLIIGSMIGAGVFMKPATMAAQLGSPLWMMAVWVIAGLFSLVGAMIYAELGTLLPVTGGIYVYFRWLFGDFIAFLYGWSAFAVINTAAIAAIAFVCADYANYFLHLPRFDRATELSTVLQIPFVGDIRPLENIGVKILAIVIVVVLTWLNARSVKAGNYFQEMSTFIKVAVIVLLIGGLFMAPGGDTRHFIYAPNAPVGVALMTGIVAAMTGAFMAYDGWINISSMAGEVHHPRRNIPRSLVVGVLVCILVYVAVNQAYLYFLPVDKMAASPLVAADAIETAWGRSSGALIAGLIVICTLGAVNGNVMATARITYAMGKDGVFFDATGKEHPRFRTPANALWLHGVWTALFILSGSFDMLADMFIFITWISYGAGAIGIFKKRKTEKADGATYRMWGYPVLPLAFILFTFFYLVVTVWNDVDLYLRHRQPVINSLLGLLITAAGIPVYYYCRKKTPVTSSSGSVSQE